MPLLWTRIGLWTCWQSSRKNVIFIILFLEGVNDSQKIQAVVEKIHKCFSYMHNPNFSSFRHIKHLCWQNVEVKVRPDFTEKYKNSGSFCKSYKEMTHWWVFFLFSFFECWEACCKCDEIQKKSVLLLEDDEMCKQILQLLSMQGTQNWNFFV